MDRSRSREYAIDMNLVTILVALFRAYAKVLYIVYTVHLFFYCQRVAVSPYV